jgi:hypothetical protein
MLVTQRFLSLGLCPLTADGGEAGRQETPWLRTIIDEGSHPSLMILTKWFADLQPLELTENNSLV